MLQRRSTVLERKRLLSLEWYSVELQFEFKTLRVDSFKKSRAHGIGRFPWRHRG